jgi:4-hydroxy-tetrahydrodipicolinate synthase
MALLAAGPGAADGACACDGPRSGAGVHSLVLLPWACDGSVDEPALEAQIRYQLAGGVSGLVVLGSIGEGECASPEARDRVIAVAARVAGGRVPLAAGVHTCDLEVALGQIARARELGATAALVKYKGRPRASAGEVLAFYRAISDAGILPVFYYHFPSDTGLALRPEELARIVRLPGVVGAKVSALDPREFRALATLARGCGKTFLSGTALNLTQFLEDGGHGAMCAEAALLPGLTARAYGLAAAGRPDDARAAQEELFVLAPLLRGGLASEGAARRRVMLTQDLGVRLPLPDNQPQARLKAALDGIGVPTPVAVCGCLPGLTAHDRSLVDRAVRHILSRGLMGVHAAGDGGR